MMRMIQNQKHLNQVISKTISVFWFNLKLSFPPIGRIMALIIFALSVTKPPAELMPALSIPVVEYPLTFSKYHWPLVGGCDGRWSSAACDLRGSVGEGYNHPSVDISLRIEPPYPDVQIDMVFVSPALARQDGKPIGALAEEAFDGKVWQRWSRHRTASNPWRPGVDNVETHMVLVGEWFRHELSKR